MNFDDQLELEHLLFTERKCRSCGQVKCLTEDFYLTRKNRRIPSAYSMNVKSVQLIVLKKKKEKQRSGSILIGSSCIVSPM